MDVKELLRTLAGVPPSAESVQDALAQPVIHSRHQDEAAVVVGHAVELLLRYLRGLGHPSGLPPNLVTQEQFQQDKMSSDLRPALFSTAIYGAPSIPPDVRIGVRDSFPVVPCRTAYLMQSAIVLVAGLLGRP